MRLRQHLGGAVGAVGDDTVLGGGKQKGVRPLEYIGEELVRKLLAKVLTDSGTPRSSRLLMSYGIRRKAAPTFSRCR